MLLLSSSFQLKINAILKTILGDRSACLKFEYCGSHFPTPKNLTEILQDRHFAN